MILAASLCVVISNARAESLLYDNGNHVQNGTPSDYIGRSQRADDFVLPFSASVTQLTWKGYYDADDNPTDNFLVYIYADNGLGAPTSPAMTSAIYSATPTITDRHLTGEMESPSHPIYQYSANIPTFDAVGGTRYWLEIYNDFVLNYLVNPNWYWSCDIQLGIGNGFYYPLFGSDWGPTPDNFTFQLFGTAVPEPSTLALLTLGGVIAFAAKLRRG